MGEEHFESKPDLEKKLLKKLSEIDPSKFIAEDIQDLKCAFPLRTKYGGFVIELDSKTDSGDYGGFSTSYHITAYSKSKKVYSFSINRDIALSIAKKVRIYQEDINHQKWAKKEIVRKSLLSKLENDLG